MTAPITITSYDGANTAVFGNGFILESCSYIIVSAVDFTITSPSSGNHPFNLRSDNAGTGYPNRSNHIQVLNCRMHDWENEAQVKDEQADYLLYQNCEFYNTGLGSGNQTYALDFMWDDYCTVRGCYFHDLEGNDIVVKGGSTYDVCEDNVIIGSTATGYETSWGILSGNGSGSSWSNVNNNYDSMFLIIRNNILNNITRGVYGTWDTAFTYVYHNLFRDCGKGNVGEFNYLTQISPSGDSRNDNYSRHVYVFNNIFYDDLGTMFPYGWATGGSYYLQDFETGNNNYFNEGHSMTLDPSGFANPNTEAGATIGDPHLTLGTTPSTWQGWVNYFRPLWDSQSTAMLVDKGSSTAGNFPYPAVVSGHRGQSSAPRRRLGHRPL